VSENSLRVLIGRLAVCVLLMATPFLGAGQVAAEPTGGAPAVRVPGFFPAGGVIRFLTETNYPPFNFAGPDGNPQGFNVDLARMLCEELKVACTIQMRRFETLIAALNGNQGDAAIASIAATVEMRARVDFTDAYYRTPARFVAKRDSPIDDPLPERLEGKRVAVVAGTAHTRSPLQQLFSTHVARGASPARSRARNIVLVTYCVCKEAAMKLLVAAIALALMSSAQAQEIKAMATSSSIPSYDNVRSATPALEKYGHGALADLWTRPDLDRRDRSIVTLSALIARSQTIEMLFYFNVALDNGVTPGEISEIITHLAFYSGWANAVSAAAIAKDVFAQRNIGSDQLPRASVSPLPIDQAAETDRAARVGGQFGSVAPGIVQYTTDILFRDLWLRPGLAV
jgi:4-carboxymuconolactone decarboxylase